MSIEQSLNIPKRITEKTGWFTEDEQGKAVPAVYVFEVKEKYDAPNTLTLVETRPLRPEDDNEGGDF